VAMWIPVIQHLVQYVPTGESAGTMEHNQSFQEGGVSRTWSEHMATQEEMSPRPSPMHQAPTNLLWNR